jgi:hypothetical protein
MSRDVVFAHAASTRFLLSDAFINVIVYKDTFCGNHVKSITGRPPSLDGSFVFAFDPTVLLCSLFRDLALARINGGRTGLRRETADGPLSESESSEEISMTVVLTAVALWAGRMRDGELERVWRFTGVRFRILRGDLCRSESDVCERLPWKLVFAGLGMVGRPWISLDENTSLSLFNDIGNGAGIAGCSDVLDVARDELTCSDSSTSSDNDR